MDVVIRKEEVKDYKEIANINYLAFHNWKPENPFVKESIMVDVLRQNSGYNPELSLVAELDGNIIGYVFFLPFNFVVLGKKVKGMIIGPVAVKPKFQKKGIGEKLIDAGHNKAMELGIELSLCCGHSEYYPKFGYRNSMFALSGVSILNSNKSEINVDYVLRNFGENDEEFIMPLWMEIIKMIT